MGDVLSGKVPEARDAEVIIERPDGSRVTVIVNIRPLKNEGGEITGALNCFHDITERKQAEALLRDSQQRLASMIELSNDAIISMSSLLGDPPGSSSPSFVPSRTSTTSTRSVAAFVTKVRADFSS